MKTCTKCQVGKGLAEFHPRRASPDGLKSWCKQCCREKKKADGPGRNLRERYGLTMDDYAAMLAAQLGGCAICRKPARAKSRLFVDHDHKTGRVRGLLCLSCNTMIGHAADSPDVLRAGAVYLDGSTN